jgi:hypothetical protein
MLTDSERKVFRWTLAFLLMCIGLVLLSGCTTILESLKRTDTVHTERTVTVRDTVVYTKADSATIKMLMDLQAMRKLMEDLRKEGPRTVRGTSHASLVMQVSGDTLLLEAKCDSLAHVLEGALRTIETNTKERTELERTLQDTRATQKGVMPGWMKGTIWIIVVAVVALLIIATIAIIINKYLFKRT